MRTLGITHSDDRPLEIGEPILAIDAYAGAKHGNTVLLDLGPLGTADLKFNDANAKLAWEVYCRKIKILIGEPAE